MSWPHASDSRSRGMKYSHQANSAWYLGGGGRSSAFRETSVFPSGSEFGRKFA
jgi:hypothetical protein